MTLGLRAMYLVISSEGKEEECLRLGEAGKAGRQGGNATRENCKKCRDGTKKSIRTDIFLTEGESKKKKWEWERWRKEEEEEE